MTFVKRLYITSITELTINPTIKINPTEPIIIQQHLRALGKDFDRFQTRMDNLAKHIEQANRDVTDVNTSARKITSHFRKIEAVDEDLIQNSLLESDKNLTLE